MAFVTVPATPTCEMIAAAGHPDAAAIWSAMIAARPAGQPGMPARLPSVGVNHRNPGFWSDIEVRNLVVDNHRQMQIGQLQSLIRDRCGADRVPSKSALSRVWKRLDLTKVKPGFPQVRR